MVEEKDAELSEKRMKEAEVNASKASLVNTEFCCLH